MSSHRRLSHPKQEDVGPDIAATLTKTLLFSKSCSYTHEARKTRASVV